MRNPWLLVALLACSALAHTPPKAAPGGPTVRTAHGQVQGTRTNTWSGHPVHCFRGLRYAAPPVGQLRFKAPVPLKPWSGVMKAFEDGAACPQPHADYYGQTSEDCLFLNVYTKELSANKPVIVFFHPGGYFFNSGRSDIFGPQYLLDHDVVLVVVQYRLGALGFMSTGDAAAKGNYGLKDQVAALKWVHENIKAFGGDPGQVTIAGNGVGASSVILHMLSPMSKGLFKRAIAMSGGGTGKWVVSREPMKTATRLGKLCKCDTSTSHKLVDCLRQVPAQSLADHYTGLREWGNDPVVVFSAVVEQEPDGFLTAEPSSIIKSGKFNQAPCIMGFTKNELEGRATEIMSNETMKNELERDWERLAPIVFYFERGSDKSKAFCKNLKQHYFSGGPVNVKGVSKIYSDALVNYGAADTAKLLTKHSKEPIYFYFSGYQGKQSYNYKKGTQEPYGVMHMDDLLYILPNSRKFPLYKETDKEGQMVQTYTSMWANFATNGDPTPGNLDIEWKPLKPNAYSHLSLEESCSIKPGLPYAERLAVWEKHFSEGQTPTTAGQNSKPLSPPTRPHY